MKKTYLMIFMLGLFSLPIVHSTSTLSTLQSQLRSMSSAFVLSRALQVAAEIGIADHMSKEPISSEVLAQKMNFHTEALYRFMRMLSSHGIFCEHDNNMFSLTDMGMLLRSDFEGSVRTFLAHDDEPRWRAYGNLKHSLQTGQPSFDSLFGMSYYDFLSKNSAEAARFDTAMKAISENESKEILKHYSFEKGSCVVDLGGGEGELLISILKTDQSLKGLVFDMPHVAEKCDFSKIPEVSNRLSAVGGDFFKSIPNNGDVYIIKRVLHNWSDDNCVSILKKCSEALSATGKLLIVEACISEKNKPDGMKDWDLYGMTLMNGKERTRAEWEALCDKAHLKIQKIISTDTFVSIIEVVKK